MPTYIIYTIYNIYINFCNFNPLFFFFTDVRIQLRAFALRHIINFLIYDQIQRYIFSQIRPIVSIARDIVTIVCINASVFDCIHMLRRESRMNMYRYIYKYDNNVVISDHLKDLFLDMEYKLLRGISYKEGIMILFLRLL